MLRIIDRMGRLWPSSGLVDAGKVDPDTLDVWFELLAELPAMEARQAVDALAKEGSAWVPAPGVVFKRAAELVAKNRVELPPPDACRDLTPDELAAIPQRRAVLQAAIGDLLARGWPTTRNGSAG